MIFSIKAIWSKVVVVVVVVVFFLFFFLNRPNRVEIGCARRIQLQTHIHVHVKHTSILAKFVYYKRRYDRISPVLVFDILNNPKSKCFRKTVILTI